MRFLPGAFLLLASLHSADKLTIDQTIDIREPADLQFSSDEQHVAFTVQEPPIATKPAQRHIWVFNTQSRQLRQWTSSLKSEHMPRWSPDGRTLAFLSDREDTTQIWLIAADGGEAAKLTAGKNSIETYRWSPDGRQIAFLAADPRNPEEEKKQKDQDDARVIDVDRKPARIWTVDIASKAVKAVTIGSWQFREVEWLPDGKRVLATGTAHPADEHRGVERLYTVSLADGRIDEFLAPKGPFGRIQVSPHGNAVAFVSSPDDGPSAQDLFVVPLDSRAPKNLTGALKDRPVLAYQWLNDSELGALFHTGFHTALETVGGTLRKLVADDSLDVSAFAASARGKVVYIAESAAVPPELWMDGAAVSHFNDSLKAARLHPAEFFQYASFDGTMIEAALYRSPGAAEARPGPLVVLVHGGPAGAWRNRFDGLTQLLVARGYTVMEPNIRGSVGYGQKFLASNRADWGGGDFKDVMAGVDDLVRRKIADPNRLAIGGWSYGGYMAEWAITQTDRFKAAVCGAGMADLATEFGTEARPEGDEWYFGTPYENLPAFQKSSPILYIKNARTPTLILQGEADTTDPISQSQMLYRGLKRYNVPAEFVVYPREPHGLRERYHIADRYRRSLEWIEKYLGKAD
jgi:dipeptidyl aminopeptidase/acylaminoacyl peptidase